MAPPKLRALQPAQPSPSTTVSPSSSAGQPLANQFRKAGYIPACEPCRKRKKKCDRSRPECARCAERGLECAYLDEASSQSPISARQLEMLTHLDNDAPTIFNLLASLPYFDALDLFNMLREMPRGRDTPVVLTEVPSSVSPQPEQNPNGIVLPPSNPLENELMVRHPIAYPILLPIALDKLPLKDLLNPRTPGMTATQVLRDVTSPSLADAMLMGDEEPSGDALYEFCKGLPHLTQLQIDYLRKIDLTSWIELPIPNQSAVRVIALYLNNDYPVLPVFHADLFLHDLSQNRPYFCSALLISALLGWACQACTCIDPETTSWSPLFFLDARNRWSQLNHDESITISSLSALQLMCMTATAHGQDDLGLAYLREGLELGQKMGILNVESGMQSYPPANWLIGYPDWRKAASYAAWGAYNLASVISLHFHKVVVKAAPGILMPGDIDDILAAEEHELSPPSVNDNIFKASCKLWMIFNAVAKSYYSQGIDMSKQVALDYAEKTYRQLLSWADELPLELVRQLDSSHAVHMLHIYFHAITTDLFRPLLQSGLASAPLCTFKADNATPQTVYDASIGQMKRLLLSHRLKMDAEVLSIFWQSCIIYVANAVIHGGDYQERQFFVQLCLAGLKELFRSYRVSGIAARGIAGMAVRKGILQESQVPHIRQQLEEIAGRFERDSQTDSVVANWILDLDLAVTDSVGAQGGKLAEVFNYMGGTLEETRSNENF